MTELEIARELEHLTQMLKADHTTPASVKVHFLELYRRVLFQALCPTISAQCKRELLQKLTDEPSI